MNEGRNSPMEPIRNPPPTGERIMTLLGTIWAEQRGLTVEIKLKKNNEQERALERQKIQQLRNQIAGRKKRKCSKSSK